jgi:hypothetical protein
MQPNASNGWIGNEPWGDLEMQGCLKDESRVGSWQSSCHVHEMDTLWEEEVAMLNLEIDVYARQYEEDIEMGMGQWESEVSSPMVFDALWEEEVCIRKAEIDAQVEEYMYDPEPLTEMAENEPSLPSRANTNFTPLHRVIIADDLQRLNEESRRHDEYFPHVVAQRSVAMMDLTGTEGCVFTFANSRRMQCRRPPNIGGSNMVAELDANQSNISRSFFVSITSLLTHWCSSILQAVYYVWHWLPPDNVCDSDLPADQSNVILSVGPALNHNHLTPHRHC